MNRSDVQVVIGGLNDWAWIDGKTMKVNRIEAFVDSSFVLNVELLGVDGTFGCVEVFSGHNCWATLDLSFDTLRELRDRLNVLSNEVGDRRCTK